MPVMVSQVSWVHENLEIRSPSQSGLNRTGPSTVCLITDESGKPMG